MLSKRIAIVAVACGLVLSGCAGEKQAATQTTPRPSIDPDEVSKSVSSHLKITVDGAISFSYDEDTKLRIVTIDEPGLEQVRFLSVGLEKFKELEGDKRFRFAFDLVGAYDGPGTYELPKVGGSTETAKPESDAEGAAKELASDLSKPILIYYELTGGAESPSADSVKNAHQFENAQKPCTVEVGENARSGELSCPEVADSTGQTVSIEMIWGPKS